MAPSSTVSCAPKLNSAVTSPPASASVRIKSGIFLSGRISSEETVVGANSRDGAPVILKASQAGVGGVVPGVTSSTTARANLLLSLIVFSSNV